MLGIVQKETKAKWGWTTLVKTWEPNTKVRFWLSKGYMMHNIEGWPKKPWYEVFDDGPDGEKGTR